VHPTYVFAAGSAAFHAHNLVSSAGLVPVLELAGQTGLWRLIGEHVDLSLTRVKSGTVNPIGKLASIIKPMMCGADSIDDANVLSGGGKHTSPRNCRCTPTIWRNSAVIARCASRRKIDDIPFLASIRGPVISNAPRADWDEPRLAGDAAAHTWSAGLYPLFFVAWFLGLG
jgi:hypothetical protein